MTRLLRQATPQKPKSTPDARRLLGAVYGQEQSWEKVARRLGLKNRGHAWEMYKGRRHDTPEMKAALRKARARRERAFAGFRVEHIGANVDRELVSMALNDVKRLERTLRSLLPQEANHE